jgi:hypothetical protein
MTACCVLLSVWSVYVDPYRRQANSLAVVRELNGQFATAPAEGAVWQRWLVTTMLGPDSFIRVVRVDLTGLKVNDARLRSLTGLRHLTDLSLDYTAITDDGTATLTGMKQLSNVSLRYTDVTDRTAQHLQALPNLQRLVLTGTEVSDESVSHLAKHRWLAELFIRWTKITGAGADTLEVELPKCAIHHHALVEEEVAAVP